MSTKTTFKRIALVAVAALGLGVLTSVAPASAASTNIGCVVAYYGATATTTANIDDACTGLAGPANSVTLATGTGAEKRVYFTISGGATTAGATSGTVAAAGGSVVIATPTKGTITVTGFAETGSNTGLFSSTATDTITITVIDVASIGVVDTAVSRTVMDGTASLSDAAPAVAGTDDVVYAAANTAVATEVAVINVNVVDKNGNAMPAATVYSASVTGPGLISISGAADADAAAAAAAVVAQSGTVRIATVTKTAGLGKFAIGVYADGNPGVGTINIYAGSVLVGTESVTFFGSVSSLTATVVHKTVGITGWGGTNTDSTVTIVAKDSLGQVVPGISPTYTSSDTTVIADGTCGTPSTITSGAGCIVTTTAKAGSATLTFSNNSKTTTAVVATSGKPSGLKLAFDKSEYMPGEKFTLTLTASNASGLPADGTYANLLLAALTPSTGVTSTLFGASVKITDGVATATGYAPIYVGGLIVSGTSGADAGSTAISLSASASISGGTLSDSAQAGADAAAEATDAANAATDAANAAAEAADAATAAAQDAADAVAALATQVNEQIAELKAMNMALQKQITSLTNLIIKIQKKVKA